MFEGQEVEGYDPDKYYRIWQRIESAEVLYDDFYSGSTESILREADFLERELVGAKRSHKSIKYSIPIYDELYRKKIWSLVGTSNIELEDFAFIQGKELQLATWFAMKGDRIIFRNPNMHSVTADVFL